MLVLILEIVVGFILAVITALVVYARWNYGRLEALGIPVMKPYFMFGSDPFGYTKVAQHEDLERYKKYGPIYGAYEGRSPVVYICDPEMIRLIHVKDFDHFVDRSPVSFAPEMATEMLDFLPGDKWKTVRSHLTPVFSSGHIKKLGKILKDLSDEYVSDVQNSMTEDRQKFCMQEFMITFLIDATAQSLLGITLPTRKDPNNFLIKLMQTLMAEDFEPNWFITLVETFPFIEKLSPMLPITGGDDFDAILDSIMEARRKSDIKENDFISILNEMMNKVKTPEFEKLGITAKTIKSQGLEFFVAGYDSVTISTSMLAYYLAKNPEIQDKLIAEVDEILSNSKTGQFDHEAVEESSYLTACISEAIRLVPAFPRPERLCTKDWTYKGITITKGLSVQIPSWAANRNPDVFPDPEEFDPERFMPENKKNINQYAMTSFGFGPRNCIGKRFAYEAIKLLMCRFLKDFRFELREDTKLDMIKGFGIISRFKKIHLDIVKRN